MLGCLHMEVGSRWYPGTYPLMSGIAVLIADDEDTPNTRSSYIVILELAGATNI